MLRQPCSSEINPLGLYAVETDLLILCWGFLHPCSQDTGLWCYFLTSLSGFCIRVTLASQNEDVRVHSSAGGGGACNNEEGEAAMASSLSAPLWSEAAISHQSADTAIWGRGTFRPPWLPQPARTAPGARAQLPAAGLGAGRGICNCTKSWIWAKLTATYCPILPLEVANLQWTLEFPNHQVEFPLQV